MISPRLDARLGQLRRRDGGAVSRPVASVPRPPAVRLPSGEEVETDAGRHWRIARPLLTLWPGAVAALEHGRAQLAQSLAERAGWHEELRQLAASFARDVLFLDLETCGLAGAAVFLIGLLHEQQGELYLTQLLARNYAEERAILASLTQLAADKRVLVTFNGKSFDWPTVCDRTTLHRLPTMLPGYGLAARADPTERWTHCDILHHARRRWKHELPNCRLQTLEWLICGRRRQDDVPSQEIPAMYQQFVRDGDPRAIRDILHHNALDLVTLLQLVFHLARA